MDRFEIHRVFLIEPLIKVVGLQQTLVARDVFHSVIATVFTDTVALRGAAAAAAATTASVTAAAALRPTPACLLLLTLSHHLGGGRNLLPTPVLNVTLDLRRIRVCRIETAEIKIDAACLRVGEAFPQCFVLRIIGAIPTAATLVDFLIEAVALDGVEPNVPFNRRQRRGVMEIVSDLGYASAPLTLRPQLLQRLREKVRR